MVTCELEICPQTFIPGTLSISSLKNLDPTMIKTEFCLRIFCWFVFPWVLNDFSLTVVVILLNKAAEITLSY